MASGCGLVTSGYVPCGCHDCFDIAIGERAHIGHVTRDPDTGQFVAGEPVGALCEDCQDAGCTVHADRPGFLNAYNHEPCQRLNPTTEG